MMDRYRSDEERWAAVVCRDPRAAEAFVYAVESTSVFCRSSCPSRRPRRGGVRFFDSSAAAAAAGYRGCQRCRPEGASAEVARVRAACAAIHADPEITMTRLVNLPGGSTRRLQRDFRQLLGCSPREYRAACQLSNFKRAGTGERHLTAAILDAGFDSSAWLYELSGALGMTLATYRRGGADEEIRYAHGECDLGRVLVGATARGICTVRFGDDRERLIEGLRAELPAAALSEATAELAPWIELVRAYVAGEATLLEVPLDVRGTEFQLRVWGALRAIPRGETRTYGELAEQLGLPGGARAVARCCANNEVPIAIPCHRVVPATGDAGGYRWGRERKRRLLSIERHTQS
jgi:AraC family transcriptional regulator of adaptative response/methylated-DNA-[protein]-cysteine methyltransferase